MEDAEDVCSVCLFVAVCAPVTVCVVVAVCVFVELCVLLCRSLPVMTTPSWDGSIPGPIGAVLSPWGILRTVPSSLAAMLSDIDTLSAWETIGVASVGPGASGIEVSAWGIFSTAPLSWSVLDGVLADGAMDGEAPPSVTITPSLGGAPTTALPPAWMSTPPV